MTQSVPVRAMMGSRPRPRYSRLAGPKAAHLVIDLQIGFLEPGSPFEVAAARAIVPAVNRVSAAVRAAGGSTSSCATRSTPMNPTAGPPTRS
ncbi:hypothetical protein ACFSTI_17020 [Rhizorhabdus histidinilytica]